MTKKIMITNPSIALYLDVAKAIGIQYDLEDTQISMLAFEISEAIMAGELRIVDPVTSNTVNHKKILVNRNGYVYVNDINDWLKDNRWPYKWDINFPKKRNKSSDPQKPLTKHKVANAFQGLHYSYEQWIKYCGSPPKWLSQAIKVRGNKGAPTTWDPTDIGLLLTDKDIPIKKIDAVFHADLKDWLKLWEEKTEPLRN
jgi:hypothetical protein